jgi:hypothetical protein
MAASGTASKGNEQYWIYKVGLMLDNKFKTVTNYMNTMRNINTMQPIPKATAQHNFALAMQTPQPLIIEAQTHLDRAQSLTVTPKVVATSNAIAKEKNWITQVLNFITAHQ